ncbi:unnamed protein product [Euphydryas editha]|uniref:Uncharacterized protein n=1 Tax=Euphydryas editha TaxID=104508 RepID=A0AAU9U746_EUPED|nr:unnamed protein product [Euphydryas editha]
MFFRRKQKTKKNGSPENLPYSDLLNIVLREIGHNLKPLSSVDKNLIIDKISFFLTNTMKMFRDCKSNKKLFKKRHKIYLEKSFHDDLPDDLKINVHDDQPTNITISYVPSICEIGEPGGASTELSTLKSSKSLGYRQQLRSRKRLLESFQNDAPSKIIQGLVSKLSAEDKIIPKAAKDLQDVIQLCLESPSQASKVKKAVTIEPQPYTAEEALGVIIDRKVSVWKARKACYPSEEIRVSDVEASVSLKGLMTHTLIRIVQSCEESFIEFSDRKGINELTCVFEGSWGFDGSTGQSFYKQSFDQSPQDPSMTENSLFATTQLKGTQFIFTCELTLSIIDGKVLHAITGTSSQLRCPFCNLTSSYLNDLELCYSKPSTKQYLKYGINPLHAWIRIFEFLLHLGYKNDPAVQKWRISKNTEESRIVQKRKERIQAEIRNKMGLLVDVVRPNAGTTNDGNTARTALSDKYRHMFADILGLESGLLDDFYIVLVTINCELPIDAPKFGSFCKAVAEKYVATYNWHPMMVTVHKILVHGQEIIESNPLPLGMLSEQAAESRNKFWHRDREQHCRKMDRKKTMIDLFHRALESSDPAISMLRLHRRQKFCKKLPLPSAVRDLLKAVEVENT